ncbi:hypothetical protein [Dyadobacter psychrotolerans]|uniref:Uncharacterized protein n=1 Tax=Dyadobacter psychrotolerans TaxID=2541721 RepID=A0A4R5DJU4_9BACT|nr:hypothetical protein [Dyadobacter psychrotolerans]TDE13637.1 hypothetical protein E0F88_17165 [Dyadobacter psychrotolerans]
MGIRELVLDQAKKEGIALGEKKGIEKGIEKGIQEGKTEVVKNMLITGRFTDQEIANFASVPEVFVTEIRKTL